MNLHLFLKVFRVLNLVVSILVMCRQSCKSWIAELDGKSEENAKTYLGNQIPYYTINFLHLDILPHLILEIFKPYKSIPSEDMVKLLT
jgi:hypothetical protein